MHDSKQQVVRSRGRTGSVRAVAARGDGQSVPDRGKIGRPVQMELPQELVFQGRRRLGFQSAVDGLTEALIGLVRTAERRAESLEKRDIGGVGHPVTQSLHASGSVYRGPQ